jgi:chloramphenicol 3-O-phosphotransferase
VIVPDTCKRAETSSHASAFPAILIVTGLMASGKSTVAQAIAKRLPRSAHVRGDTFRKMIIGGRAEMAPEPTSKALAQMELRVRIACNVSAAYADSGMNVIYQDVLLGAFLEQAISSLSQYSPGVVVLNPTLETVADRDAARSKTAYSGSWTPAVLEQALIATPQHGLWLDTSTMSAAQTAQYVMQHSELTLARQMQPGGAHKPARVTTSVRRL